MRADRSGPSQQSKSSAVPAVPESAEPLAAGINVLPYAVVIFVSAFLLFQIEPILAKIVLPWFGGSAAVWTTCILFFQIGREDRVYLSRGLQGHYRRGIGRYPSIAGT